MKNILREILDQKTEQDIKRVCGEIISPTHMEYDALTGRTDCPFCSSYATDPSMSCIKHKSNCLYFTAKNLLLKLKQAEEIIKNETK